MRCKIPLKEIKTNPDCKVEAVESSSFTTHGVLMHCEKCRIQSRSNFVGIVSVYTCCTISMKPTWKCVCSFLETLDLWWSADRGVPLTSNIFMFSFCQAGSSAPHSLNRRCCQRPYISSALLSQWILSSEGRRLVESVPVSLCWSKYKMHSWLKVDVTPPPSLVLVEYVPGRT